MSDDEGDVAASSAPSSSASFDPAARALAASLQFRAQTQQPHSLRRSFACSRLGTAEGTEAAIASLEALLLSAAGSELGLPIVALLLSAHNARTVGKDKRRLLDLKSKLKVVSKQSSEAGLQLAGRYFLASNKVPKARQCIEKLISKNKKDIELLSLFGWIYLQSGEDKYIEKSMQVFKKAAKLSLPNFDIAALMGRAKYFEYNGKISKAIQALDSICKIYPTFLPAFEEKLRLLSVCSRWKDLPRVISEIRSKRLACDCAGEAIVVCYALALESFLTDCDPAKHARAVEALVQAIASEEGEAAGGGFWIWQCSQLLSRLSARADAPSLALLAAALSAPTAAAASSKAGPNVNLLYECAYLSLRRGEFEAARARFATVAATALAVEKSEKPEEDDAAAAAPAASAAGKVNEDERLQKACAAVGVILAHLGSGALDEAAAAMETLAPEVAQYASVSGAPQPLPVLLYARAALAAARSDAALAARLLAELVDAHALLCAGRNPALDDESLAPVVANLHPGLANAVSPLNRWVLAIDPWVVGEAAALALAIVGLQGSPLEGFASVQARPVSAAVAPHLDLLTAMQSLVRSVLAFQPGSFDLWQALALLAWVAQDAATASEAAGKAEGLAGAKDARAAQLKRIVSIAAAAPAAVAAAVAPASSAGLSTPSKPLASSSAAAASSAVAAPSTAQRHQYRASLGAETGIDFDDDEEDVDALFKAAADVGDELASPAAGRAAREAQAEREAQQHLDELESRSQNGEATRLAREAEQKRIKDEAVRRAAEQEAAAALAEASKADQRAAELRKAEEIAALRAAREAEKRRQAEEIERAEREREEQRELDRQERMRQRTVAAGGVSEVTAIQSFDDGDDVAPLVALDREPERKPVQQMKWNRPADAIVVPAAAAPSPAASPNPASSASSPSPLLSPNGNAPNPSPSPTGAPSVSGLQRSPSLSPNASPTPQQLQGYGAAPSPTAASSSSASSAAQQRQMQSQRSEDARLAQEKKEKIMAAGLQIEQAKKFTKTAFWGEVFLKHGRRGSPHERNVTLEVTGSELKFDWSSGQLKAHKNDIQLVEGKGTPVFQRATADRTRAERCFSIVTATRTLDLEAPSDETRDYWVMGIKLLLKYLK